MSSTLSICFAASPLSSKRTASEFISSSQRCLLPIRRLSSSNLRNSCSFRVAASSHQNRSGSLTEPLLHGLRSFAATTVLLGAALSVSGITYKLPARAEAKIPTAVSEQERNEEGAEALEVTLQQKLDSGENDEALAILNRLVALHPQQTEWKVLTARLLSKTGETQDARKVFDEILERDPSSFEALFENTLLMDRCGEGEAAIRRLEEAIKVAKDENKERDARLKMALMKFLQKDADEALRTYRELCKEDPDDFRPYFCQGMILSLLEKHEEAKEMLDKYYELSPKKFKAV